MGQCAVSALVVQDFLGGCLLRCVVNGRSHYLNRLPSGEEVDLTIEQFGPWPVQGPATERRREYVLSFGETAGRYRLLRRRVDDLFCGHADS
jgi:hypothetical protein